MVCVSFCTDCNLHIACISTIKLLDNRRGEELKQDSNNLYPSTVMRFVHECDIKYKYFSQFLLTYLMYANVLLLNELYMACIMTVHKY